MMDDMTADRATVDARLGEAMEAVYRVFAGPAPAIIEGCPCCIETRGVDVLLTTPLRALSGGQLWRYVSGVFYTVGSERDFRYFLPRILEISVQDASEAHYPQVVLGKLRLANWQSWPRHERAAIEALVDAWFERDLMLDLTETLEFWPVANTVEAMLCATARADLPLEGLLARLQDPAMAPVLAQLKADFPKRPENFWADAPDGFAQVATMLGDGGE